MLTEAVFLPAHRGRIRARQQRADEGERASVVGAAEQHDVVLAVQPSDALQVLMLLSRPFSTSSISSITTRILVSNMRIQDASAFFW